MTLPAIIIWDLTFANAIVPNAGHLSAGYVFDEIPPVTDFNYLLWYCTTYIKQLAGGSTGWPLVTSISSVTTKSINHGFNRPINVVVYTATNGTGTQIIPDSVVCTDLNNVTVNFAVSQSGSIVIF